MTEQTPRPRKPKLLEDRAFFNVPLIFDPTFSAAAWVEAAQAHEVDLDAMQKSVHFRARVGAELLQRTINDCTNDPEMAEHFPLAKWQARQRMEWNKEEHYFNNINRLLEFAKGSRGLEQPPVEVPKWDRKTGHQARMFEIMGAYGPEADPQERLYAYSLLQRRWKHCLDSQYVMVDALNEDLLVHEEALGHNPAFKHLANVLYAYEHVLSEGQAYFRKPYIKKYLAHIDYIEPENAQGDVLDAHASEALADPHEDATPIEKRELNDNDVFWHLVQKVRARPYKRDPRIQYNVTPLSDKEMLDSYKGELLTQANREDAALAYPVPTNMLSAMWQDSLAKMQEALLELRPAAPKGYEHYTTTFTHPVLLQRSLFVDDLAAQIQHMYLREDALAEQLDKQLKTKTRTMYSREKQRYDAVDQYHKNATQHETALWLGETALQAQRWCGMIEQTKAISAAAKQELLRPLQDYVALYEAMAPQIISKKEHAATYEMKLARQAAESETPFQKKIEEKRVHNSKGGRDPL